MLTLCICYEDQMRCKHIRSAQKHAWHRLKALFVLSDVHALHLLNIIPPHCVSLCTLSQFLFPPCPPWHLPYASSHLHCLFAQSPWLSSFHLSLWGGCFITLSKIAPHFPFLRNFLFFSFMVHTTICTCFETHTHTHLFSFLSNWAIEFMWVVTQVLFTRTS